MIESKKEKSRSIFFYYYSVCTSIILVSLILLSVLTTAVSGYFFSKEKFDSLRKVTNQINIIIKSDYYDPFGKFLNPNKVSNDIIKLAATNEAEVIILSNEGKVIRAASYNGIIDEKILDKYIGEDAYDKLIKTGEFNERDKLNDIFPEKMFISGSVIEDNFGRVLGFTLVCCPANEYIDYLHGLIKALIQCAFIALIISFIFIYYSTDAMTVPIKQISTATDDFAHGDLNARAKINDDSPTEIIQLANSFNNMADDIAIREKSSRAFVANVSHELKTPVTTISGFIDGILDGTIPKNEEEKYLKIVSSESKRLSKLVVAMLNMARIEAGEMQPKLGEVDLGELIIQTVLTFEQAISKKNIDILGLDTLDKHYVNADLDLTSQVVYNLVENAVKFTPNSGYIEINCYSDGATVSTEIKNSGEGLTEEDSKHLFDRFYKSDRSRGLDKTGVGLGLNIVRTLIQMQNGSIKVSSIQNEYTKFTFTLPKYVQRNIPVIYKKKEVD